MKLPLRLALLGVTAAGFSMASPARATDYNGDLIIGFTAGSGNDVIYDLGPVSSLADGETWNLNSLISGFELTTVHWGVVGNTLNAGGRQTDNQIYSTTASSTLTPPAASSGVYASAQAAVANMYSLFPTAGAGNSLSIPANSSSQNSWYEQTVNPSTPTQYRNAYENPNVTGATSAALWAVDDQGGGNTLLGSFSLAANGVVTFHTVSTLPPPPQLRLSRIGNTNSISFLSKNGTTYTLFLTNSAGLKTPVTNWPSLPGAITGDGTAKSFQDATTDPNRFYRVQAN